MYAILLVVLQTAYHSIGNQSLSVSVNDALCAYRPGAVVYMLDKATGSEITGSNQFSGINCGSYLPANGVVEMLSDTSLVFHSACMTDGSSFLPIDIEIEYTLVGRGLEIRYRFEFLEDTEVLSPLEVDFNIFQWDSLEMRNQTAIDECFPLDGGSGFQRFSGDQIFRLAGGLPEAIFILPNNAKGIAVILDEENYAYLSLRILDVEAPRENCAGPDLHSVIPAGQVEEYYIRFSMDELFAPVFISGHPFGAEHSAGWMIDELPFVHPPEGWIWSFTTVSSGDEPTAAGLISLLEDHPLMKMNFLILADAILTPNRDSVWFEPGYEDSWSHWHCTWRISTLAPPEYLEFLLSIQNDVYPWADRVRMGSHGYHHTPNPDSSYGAYHEFITYEPDEHQERFRVSMLDIDACGLDTNLVRVIRFPGHRSSLSGLQAIIDHGFTFFCNGWRLIDWYAGKQFRNQWISRFQTVNGRIWGSNSVWWGDYHMKYLCEYLSDVMDRGKFCLLGCHPGPMLGAYGNPDTALAAYSRIDSILTSLENDYSNFLWLFPSEYGDFLEGCFNISVVSIDGHGPDLGMTFSGPVLEGLTFCAMLDEDDVVNSVSLDGEAIPWEIRSGGRLFAVASERPDAEHHLVISMDPLGSEGDYSDHGVSLRAVSPTPGGTLSLTVGGVPVGAPIRLDVFDVIGRLRFTRSMDLLSSEMMLRPEEELAPGLYFVRMRVGEAWATARTVVIP